MYKGMPENRMQGPESISDGRGLPKYMTIRILVRMSEYHDNQWPTGPVILTVS